MCEPMTRIKQILYAFLACVLAIGLVSCATPPPVRQISPEILLHSEKLNEAMAKVRAQFDATLDHLSLSKCVRILSIDGGGVRGIIPATILKEIENRTDKRIAELFDAIVGTSTGAILTLGLTKPDEIDPSKPAYTADDLIQFYIDEGEKIFPQGPMTVFRQIWGPKYSADGIEAVLQKKFGDTYVYEALTQVLIPTYDIETRSHVFFTTYGLPDSMPFMWEVARAASAAPTFFPPFRIACIPRGEQNGKKYYALIDGGVFANDPSPHAVAFARRDDDRLQGKPYDLKHSILLVSIGTGRVPTTTRFENAWSWGVLGWIHPLVDIAFSDPGGLQDTQHLMGLYDRYFRLQPEIHEVSAAVLDDASKSNLVYLRGIAQDYIKENHALIEKIVGELLRERPSECKRVE
jgi:uncharacterized protein